MKLYLPLDRSSKRRVKLDFRTLRTPHLMFRAYAREEEESDGIYAQKYNNKEKGVLSVLAEKEGQEVPYLALDGTLVIPFNSPARFHWWKGGQNLCQTLAEVQSRRATVCAQEDQSLDT